MRFFFKLQNNHDDTTEAFKKKSKLPLVTMGKECCNSGESGSDHKHEHGNQTEEIVYHNHFVLNALVMKLIEKGVISKEELEGQMQTIQEEQQKAQEEAVKQMADAPKEEPSEEKKE
ncbi:MAG: hypothetical protein ACI8Y7_000431 [Candidatus Woesearchaeota archaeon]